MSDIPQPYTDLFSPETEDRREPQEGSFPEISRLPHNWGRNTVDQVLKIDLMDDPETLIVTGYTSLLRLVTLMAGLTERQDVRLLIGNEPFPITTGHMTLEPVSLPEEIRQYWLNRRISLLQYPEVFAALEKIRMGQVDAACLQIPGRMMHAKMIITERAALLGSSNYSDAGLTRNLEANVRFKPEEEPKRYQETKDYAEALFSLGSDYRPDLIKLLEALLRPADWRDCLARACSELLEGHWARKYTRYTGIHGDSCELWPSQHQGVAQALWIIENLGSVLVADATGSGKTRMGTALQRAVHDKLWRTGNVRGGGMALICPPGVTGGWRRELLRYGLSHQPLSQGALSFADKSNMDEFTAQVIRQAQILTVDEAHNYLNSSSKRAQVLLRNLADHVLLFTATPINKSASDLLCLVNVLGADNFDPQVIQQFNRWLRMDVKSMRAAREEQLEALKTEIARFTVRRTKREFNRLIDSQPEAYRNKHGVSCRYPRHDALPYETGESPEAISLAEQIRQLAGELQGVAYITKAIEPNAFETDDGSLGDPTAVIQGRLDMARRSAIYQIMSHLRSSRVAAWSHVAGAHSANQQFGLSLKADKAHGGMLTKLADLSDPPGVQLPEGLELPDTLQSWLTDSVTFIEARDADIEIYNRIRGCLAQMDDSRELAKLRLLDSLFVNEEKLGVLAFDRHPATLMWLNHLADQHGLLSSAKCLTATGSSSKTDRKAVNDHLDNENHLDSNLVVFCSDAMSEGYNLQNASVVVHLDMPSVVRLVEQRIGRVDRMDSVHPCVRVYWPQDHAAFALRADDRLIERFEANALLLGSNFRLPDAMQTSPDSRISDEYRSILAAAELEEISWDGISDAFAPVRSLLGGEGLVPWEYYEAISDANETGTWMSAVTSMTNWAFFCISGTEFGAPKWVLFTDSQDEALVDLADIADFLSSNLDPNTEDEQHALYSDTCYGAITHYLARLDKLERDLLPRRKQVALREMTLVLKAWRRGLDEDETLFYNKLLSVLEGTVSTQRAVNWSLLADYWLELIRPVWYDALKTARGKRAILLEELRSTLISHPLPFEQVRARFVSIPDTTPIKDRVAACIIGLHDGRL